MIIIMRGEGAAVQKIVICGTGDSQQLLLMLAEDYEKEHPGTTIDVPDSIGSGGGIRAVAKGDCDLGRVARPIKEKEEKLDLNYTLFALSPVVIAANRSVDGIDSLSTGQIIDIFSGMTKTWDELGGSSGKIFVANREAGDSSRTVLEKTLPGFRDISTFAGKTVYTTPETIDTLSKYKNTIGYVPFAMVMNTDLKVIKIDGIAPSLENVMDGKYRPVTPFGLVWKGELDGPAKAFTDFIFGARGKEIIKQYGAVPAH